MLIIGAMEKRDPAVSVFWEVCRTLLVIVGTFVAMIAFGFLSMKFPWMRAALPYVLFGVTFVVLFLLSSHLPKPRPRRRIEDEEFLDGGADDEGDGFEGANVPVVPSSPILTGAAVAESEDSQRDSGK